MEESYGEGVATHADPESCAGVRKGTGEALTGAHAGRVLSRERPNNLECRRRRDRRKATPGESISQDSTGLHAVRDLEHAWKHLIGNREIPCPPLRYRGRIRKSEDAI